ncbi:hypothetical protein HPP92_011508 [Vanilla planifolia]|uniref:phosphoribosylanthranilate isomerase n=1 Tax=Vanilla planifolia TaxID=51239 RepID=A0A835QVU1_VANPL|nr:hypothetical protein HPP92_011508 [Vanilla planifolia]
MIVEFNRLRFISTRNDCLAFEATNFTFFIASQIEDMERIGISSLPFKIPIGHIYGSNRQLSLPSCSKMTKVDIENHNMECSLSEKQKLRAHPIVKMCGITSAKDAELAAQAGADLIGMIMWPSSRRSVSIPVAKEISKVVRDNGAMPVGVFVDDDLNTMLRASEEADLEYLQLHGDGSRSALLQLVRANQIIYVLHVDADGKLLNNLSDAVDSCVVDWILVDSAEGGSGKGFNWHKLRLPPVRSKHGWLLAGGLHPGNVMEAIVALRPDGVDVSSGICSLDGIQKDPSKISSFISKVNSSSL